MLCGVVLDAQCLVKMVYLRALLLRRFLLLLSDRSGAGKFGARVLRVEQAKEDSISRSKCEQRFSHHQAHKGL